MCSKNLKQIQRGRRHHDQICFIRDSLRDLRRIIHYAEWELHTGTSCLYLQEMMQISWDILSSDFGVLDDIYNERYQCIPREMCQFMKDIDELKSENKKTKQEMKSLRSKFYNEQHKVTRLKKVLSNTQMQLASIRYYELDPLLRENEILRNSFILERKRLRFEFENEKHRIIYQMQQERNTEISKIQYQVHQLQQENSKLNEQLIQERVHKKENETPSSSVLHEHHEAVHNKVTEMQGSRTENSPEQVRPVRLLQEKKTITTDEMLGRIKKPSLHETNESLENNIKVLMKRLTETSTELERFRLQLPREKEQVVCLQQTADEVEVVKEQAKITEQEKVIRFPNLQQTIDEQNRKIYNLQAELEQSVASTNSNRKVDLTLEENLNPGEDIQLQLADTRCRLKDVQQELEDTKSRLSRAMGDKLTDNNPNIADLSDKNRPTKISERYQELYDNQWTDAFEIIDMSYNNEEKTINMLKVIIKDAMKFCTEEATNQMMEIKKSFVKDQELPSNMRKQVKDCRKALAELYGRGLFENYWPTLCNRHTEAREVPDYVKECFEICWLMAVQDPPVVFGPEIRHNDYFNKDYYKAYTKSGDRVEYVVWPVLFLHQDGPVLCKGVAQGKEK